MACQKITFVTGEIYSVATALKTMLQLIAATNVRLRVMEIHIAGKGVVSTYAPALWTVMYQTNAGTPEGTATTPVGKKWNQSNGETVQTTSKAGSAAATTPWTVEPTASDIVHQEEVHPQGRAVITFGPNGLDVKGGGRLGICVTDPNSQQWNVTALCEE